MSEHVYPVATVTAPGGNVSTVAGPSVPAWAWNPREYGKTWRTFAIDATGATPRPGFRVTWELRAIDPDTGEIMD